MILLWEYEKLWLKGSCQYEEKTILTIEFVKYYTLLASLNDQGQVILWDLWKYSSFNIYSPYMILKFDLFPTGMHIIVFRSDDEVH